MDFFKKSVPNTNSNHSDEKSENEKENIGVFDFTTNACQSAYKILENTVDESVNAVVTGGTEVVKTVEDVGKGCADVVDQGVKVVKEGIDLTETGVSNIMRLINMGRNVYHIVMKYKHYLETDSIFESTMALIFWIFICYIFQVWMIPASILVILVKNYIQRQLLGIPAAEIDKMLNDNEKDMSIIQKLEAVENIIVAVKNILGKVELLLGRLFDVLDVYLPQFFWTVVLIQIVLTAILMFIPINYIIMLWGISLYAKRFSKTETTTPNKKNVGTSPKNNSFSTLKKTVPDVMLKKLVENSNVCNKMFSKSD